MSATREVISFAQRNGGIFTTREAAALGLASSTLSRRVSDGIFVRISRGLLALPGTSTRPDILMRAAGRLIGAVVSHQSAARLHGMEPIPKSPPSVTVSHRSTYIFPGLTVHQSTDLLAGHVTTVGHLKVTNPARTIVDLAKVLGPRRLERVLDNSLAGGVVDFAQVADLCLTLARRGKTGMPKLRLILAARAGEVRYAESELEAMLFQLLTMAALPLPERQFHATWLEAVDGRVDFAYPQHRIVIEADSRRWHALFDAFEQDRRRDIAAQLAGWVILRFTWRMIIDDPDFVIRSVRGALDMP